MRLRRADDGEQATSLVAIAVGNAGILRGGQAAAIAATWAMARADLGRELGDGQGLSAAVREYASWTRKSERTAWRDVARFRDGFPGEESPERLAALIVDVAAERGQRSVSADVLVAA